MYNNIAHSSTASIFSRSECYNPSSTMEIMDFSRLPSPSSFPRKLSITGSKLTRRSFCTRSSSHANLRDKSLRISSKLEELDRPSSSGFPLNTDLIQTESKKTLQRSESDDQVSSDRNTETVSVYRPKVVWFAKSPQEEIDFIDRGINASIAGAAAVFALAKIVTVDQNYWHGWTVFEILRYAPIHNWDAYEEALNNNPLLAKMMISGVVYALGDWIAQCYEGKPILDFSRSRMIRSGIVGFCLHGSLSHFYYHLCEDLFPFQEWWVVPLKVAFDQTIWSGFWNSVYFVVLGILRLEAPLTILAELKETFFPLLTAGWKLWPFAHIVTYGIIPVEQRLLWVDCVELVWVTILSMYSNEKAEARLVEGSNDSEASTKKCKYMI